MPYLTDFMGDLDESDPAFRDEWARRLAAALKEISSRKIDGETFEGGIVLYKGAIALHIVFEALSALPETRDSLEPLFHLQAALANARYGSRGPLQLSDPEARKARGKAGNPMSVQRRAASGYAALAVELLVRADTPLKLTEAYKAVAEMFGSAGVRAARGGRLSKRTIEMWHTRCLDKETLEHAGIQKQLNHWLPLTREGALAQARLCAREAARAQKI